MILFEDWDEKEQQAIQKIIDKEIYEKSSGGVVRLVRQLQNEQDYGVYLQGSVVSTGKTGPAKKVDNGMTFSLTMAVDPDYFDGDQKKGEQFKARIEFMLDHSDALSDFAKFFNNSILNGTSLSEYRLEENAKKITDKFKEQLHGQAPMKIYIKKDCFSGGTDQVEFKALLAKPGEGINDGGKNKEGRLCYAVNLAWPPEDTKSEKDDIENMSVLESGSKYTKGQILEAIDYFQRLLKNM